MGKNQIEMAATQLQTWVFVYLIGLLVAWLDGSVGWLAGWLTGWLVGCFVWKIKDGSEKQRALSLETAMVRKLFPSPNQEISNIAFFNYRISVEQRLICASDFLHFEQEFF